MPCVKQWGLLRVASEFMACLPLDLLNFQGFRASYKESKTL